MPDISAIALIPGARQSAAGAINRALKAEDRNEAVVASSTSVDSRDTIGALVDARRQLLYTRAAVKIMAASDEMERSLLDIRA